VSKPKLSTNFSDAKAWYEFITKNIQEVNPKLANVTAFSSVNYPNILINRSKRFIFARLVNVYKRIMHFIPRRLHLALKIILLGKI
jgi:hypothetical protein